VLGIGRLNHEDMRMLTRALALLLGCLAPLCLIAA